MSILAPFWTPFFNENLENDVLKIGISHETSLENSTSCPKSEPKM
jgi:hypothetical protein